MGGRPLDGREPKAQAAALLRAVDEERWDEALALLHDLRLLVSERHERAQRLTEFRSLGGRVCRCADGARLELLQELFGRSAWSPPASLIAEITGLVNTIEAADVNVRGTGTVRIRRSALAKRDELLDSLCDRLEELSDESLPTEASERSVAAEAPSTKTHDRQVIDSPPADLAVVDSRPAHGHVIDSTRIHAPVVEAPVVDSARAIPPAIEASVVDSTPAQPAVAVNSIPAPAPEIASPLAHRPDAIAPVSKLDALPAKTIRSEPMETALPPVRLSALRAALDEVTAPPRSGISHTDKPSTQTSTATAPKPGTTGNEPHDATSNVVPAAASLEQPNQQSTVVEEPSSPAPLIATSSEVPAMPSRSLNAAEAVASVRVSHSHEPQPIQSEKRSTGAARTLAETPIASPVAPQAAAWRSQPLPSSVAEFELAGLRGHVMPKPLDLEKLLDQCISDGRYVEAAAFAQALSQNGGAGNACDATFLIALTDPEAEMPKESDLWEWLRTAALDQKRRRSIPAALFLAIEGVLSHGWTTTLAHDDVEKLCRAGFASAHDASIRELVHELLTAFSRGVTVADLQAATRRSNAEDLAAARKALEEQFERLSVTSFKNLSCTRAWKEVHRRLVPLNQLLLGPKPNFHEALRQVDNLAADHMLKKAGVTGDYRDTMMRRVDETKRLVREFVAAEQRRQAAAKPTRGEFSRLFTLLEGGSRHALWGRLVARMGRHFPASTPERSA